MPGQVYSTANVFAPVIRRGIDVRWIRRDRRTVTLEKNGVKVIPYGRPGTIRMAI